MRILSFLSRPAVRGLTVIYESFSVLCAEFDKKESFKSKKWVIMTFILLYKTGMYTTITHNIFLLQNRFFRVLLAYIAFAEGAGRKKINGFPAVYFLF